MLDAIRAPFRPLDDRWPAETHAYLRWERATLAPPERERFELDTLASRRAVERPSAFSRLRAAFARRSPRS